MVVVFNNKSIPPGPDEAFELEAHPQILTLMLQLFGEFGAIYKIFSKQRNKYTYVLSDPEMVKHVLITNNRNYEKGVGIDRVQILLGNGIMVSEGAYWRRQRRMIQPAFHKKVIEQLAADIVATNQMMLARWKEKAQRGVLLNLTDELSEITSQIVLRALFSRDFDGMDNGTGRQPFAILTAEHARDLLFAMKFRGLSSVIMEVIHARREQGRMEEDFLSMMMAARDQETGKGMSDKELVDETMTLIVAGHETTASALTWAWYLLSRNTAVYAKAKAEALAFRETELGFQELQHMPYIKQVIDEAMRLYPPGWLLTRKALTDDQIGTYHVPAGTDIFISPYLIHRHPTIWENPESFDPDRFDPSLGKERHRFAYFPFSGGPRQCIGDYFAQVEMQLHIALVLRELDVEVLAEEPVALEAQINLRPSKAFFARVKI